MNQITFDDDIYSGYNDYPTVYSTKDLDQDEVLQEALKTSYAKRSIVSASRNLRGSHQTVLFKIRNYSRNIFFCFFLCLAPILIFINFLFNQKY